MKKLVTLLSALACLALFAAPASAVHLTDADKSAIKEMVQEKWDFYGSARMETFYTMSDEESTAYSDDNVALDHDMNTVSRLGASADYGDVGGRVELEVNAWHDGGQSVNTRLLYGTVELGPGQLLVGQNWTPFTLSNFYSKQTYPSDTAFLGFCGYDHRQPQLAYTVENLTVSLVRPHGAAEGGLGSLEGNSTARLPELQVSYNTNINGIGVYTAGIVQSYKLAEGNDPNEGDRLTSYAVSANVRLGELLPGPMYTNFGGWYGQNAGNMGFWTGGHGLKMLSAGSASADVDNANGEVVEDATTYAGSFVVGTEVNDVGLEAGFGYSESDRDDFDSEDNVMGGYLLAQIPLHEEHNVFIQPEIGFSDYMDDRNGDDQGTETYVGMKTEVNF